MLTLLSAPSCFSSSWTICVCPFLQAMPSGVFYNNGNGNDDNNDDDVEFPTKQALQ